MNMINVAFVIAILGEIALPFGVMLWLKKQYGTKWMLFGVGVLTFIASQVLHIPLLAAFSAILKYQMPPYDVSYSAIFLEAGMLGLLAGLCEETARLVGYWILKDRAKTFGSALTLGIGHGGIESIVVGITVLFTYVTSLLALHSHQPVVGATPQSAAAIFAYPWYVPLVGLFERFTAVSLHLTLSVMVWQAVTRRAWGWYAGAVLYHALVDAMAVALPLLGRSTFLLEGILGVLMLINLWALSRVHRREAKLAVVELPI